jgi:hypothetical protein
VWKNLLTKAQRQALKDLATIEQLSVFAVEKTEVSESATQSEVDRLAVGTASQEGADLDEWMTLENLQAIASNLAECDSAETLALLRECWHPQVMNAACKLLSPEKHLQIKNWVLQLNGEK